MTNKETVQEVAKAILFNEMEIALGFMTDEVSMSWPGFNTPALQGKDAIREFFKTVPPMRAFGESNFIAEGDLVAGTGAVISIEKDGSEKKSYYCDLYTLEKGKIKSIQTYMVFEQEVS